MEAGVGMVWPQAEEYRQPPEGEKTGNGIFPRAPGGSAALLTP